MKTITDRIPDMLNDVAVIERRLETVGSAPGYQVADLCCHVRALADECERLRAGLELLAQVRHVSGSAQAHMRHNLAIVDAVLAGSDVRNLEEVEAIGRAK